MNEHDIYMLKSILGQLRQLKDGVAYSRYRSMLGMEVLADNCDWLDCKIDELEKKPKADDYNGTRAFPDEN